MNGWLIKLAEWSDPRPLKLFAVAESDPHQALIAAQKHTGAAPKQRLETVEQLSADRINELRLQPGQLTEIV